MIHKIKLLILPNMPLNNKDITNILSIQFENISKYLDYNDYIIFFEMYAPKNIEKFKRKCVYCNKIPICPVNVKYPYMNLVCNKLLVNPICYVCCIENWMYNYNKLKFREKYKIGYVCPFKCCQLNYKIDKYHDKYINYNINWDKLKKIKYYKCHICNKILKNITHYQIYKHHKISYCCIVLKKMKYGFDDVSRFDSSDESSDSEYDDDSDL